MTAENGDGGSVLADFKRALDPGNFMIPGRFVRMG